jgi:type I restriction enzyme, S subunit
MAVDSLRDTFHINRVKPEDLSDRLTAQSYRPDIIKAIKQVHDWGTWDRLENLCAKPISQGRTPVYASTGRACLKTRNVVDLIVSREEVDWVSEQYAKTVKRFWIQDEDLLMTRSGSGSIGRVSIYFGHDEPLTNEELFRISIAKSYDSAFIGAFLTCWWGKRIIEQGISGSTGQLKLVQDHVSDLPIILPDTKAQKYIGDKVRWAERLRERSRCLLARSNKEIEKLIEGKNKPLASQSYSQASNIEPHTTKVRFNRVDSNNIDPRRLDPDYYHPQYIEDEVLLKSIDAEQLGSIGRFFAGPFGSKLPSILYKKKGIPLFRIGNIGEMQLEEADMAYLDPEVHLELKASEVLSGDLLIVKASVSEKICKIPESIPKANITQHIIAIRPNGKFDIDYIAAFLFSSYGKRQLIRRSLGSIIQYLGVEDARTVLFPKADNQTQTQIGNLVRSGIQSRESAKLLTTAAKLLVEALIEGKLSEDDLKAAQVGLEQGDTTLDRDILTRLSRKGIDRPNEFPLFPNLDDLYTALSQLKAAETTEEGSTNNGQASTVYTLPEQLTLPLASETAPGSYPTTQEVLG